QVRNRGTIGGNVCVNDPTNHLPPLLVALDAHFTIRGADGERTVDASDFFQGVYLTAVGVGELLTKVSVPPAVSGTGDGFAAVTIGKHGTCIVDAAASISDEGGVGMGTQPASSLAVSVAVNGEQIEEEVPARRLLVHFLRDDLGLTGTHVGCDTGNCGACTVHLNGEPVKSCMLLTVQADGAALT